jgi:hypothetical protein
LQFQQSLPDPEMSLARHGVHDDLGDSGERESKVQLRPFEHQHGGTSTAELRNAGTSRALTLLCVWFAPLHVLAGPTTAWR